MFGKKIILQGVFPVISTPHRISFKRMKLMDYDDGLGENFFIFLFYYIKIYVIYIFFLENITVMNIDI